MAPKKINESVQGCIVSQRQWDDYLSVLPKHQRSGYVRTALDAFITAHPVIRAIPIHEPPDEPLRRQTLTFQATPAIVAWLSQLPAMTRSYVIRYALNWYRLQLAEDGQLQQPRFRLDEPDLLQTGTNG